MQRSTPNNLNLGWCSNTFWCHSSSSWICVASSDKLILSATYDYKSNVTIADELVNAVKRSVNISLWRSDFCYNQSLISGGPTHGLSIRQLEVYLKRCYHVHVVNYGFISNVVSTCTSSIRGLSQTLFPRARHARVHVTGKHLFLSTLHMVLSQYLKGWILNVEQEHQGWMTSSEHAFLV